MVLNVHKILTRTRTEGVRVTFLRWRPDEAVTIEPVRWASAAMDDLPLAGESPPRTSAPLRACDFLS